MQGCAECCPSQEENFIGSPPQHSMLTLPKVMGPLTSSAALKDTPVNPYQVLQIRRDATPTEIKQAFKRLALLNHPGRESTSMEGRLRKWQSFNLLAACYETLMDADSRRRYDNICRELEQSKLQAGVRGALFVGGKPLRSSSFDDDSIGADRTATTGVFSLLPFKRRRDASVPPLSRTSSESSATEEDRRAPVLDHDESCCAFSQELSSFTSPSKKGNRSVPAATVTTKGSLGPHSLVDAAISEEEEEAEAHFTESTTQRLFGGPLSNLFKARNFEPFEDPYDIFEGVFGSQPFPRFSRKEIRCTDDDMTVGRTQADVAVSPTSPRSPSAWRGEKHTTPNGNTTIYTTSRIVQDRLLIRTETVTRAPDGRIKKHITVTTEPLSPSRHVEKEGSGEQSNPFLICCRTTVLSDSPEYKGICEDTCQLYENVVQQLDFTKEEFIEEWRRMLSYSIPLNFTSSL